MSYDYVTDVYGKECLELAKDCRSHIGFGAVFVKEGKITGRGWNKRSTPAERKLLTHVDYAIHAEQACVLDALRREGFIQKGKISSIAFLEEGEIYVAGVVLRGPHEGKITMVERKVFICKKCVSSILIPFNVSVNVPYVRGWASLTPKRAEKTSAELCGDGYWKRFCHMA